MSFFNFFKKNRTPVNSDRVSKKTILEQMNEPRPLPMGQKEFTDWTDRIISGALIPTDNRESLVGVLASMLMQLGPTESVKPDAFFIHSLRKAAVNEVAHANFQAIKKRKETEAQVQSSESASNLAKLQPKEASSTT